MAAASAASLGFSPLASSHSSGMPSPSVSCGLLPVKTVPVPPWGRVVSSEMPSVEPSVPNELISSTRYLSTSSRTGRQGPTLSIIQRKASSAVNISVMTGNSFGASVMSLKEERRRAPEAVYSSSVMARPFSSPSLLLS